VEEKAVQLTDVTKTYRVGREKLYAVQGASLKVAAGELLAIVGPSGSGKTTLTHMIGGLLKPTAGTIVIGGTDITRLRDRALSTFRNKHIGFIFQNYSLLPGYTALENVCLPLIVAGVSPAERKRRAAAYLELVGLGKQMAQKADQLSGGQRQRVAIARALAMQPKIVIADEPTGSLDSARGHEIMNILEHLAHIQEMAVIMVTHDLTLAAKADRQVRMLDGAIQEAAHADR
jgi:putative ABC transport system ATP-binding protein